MCEFRNKYSYLKNKKNPVEMDRVVSHIAHCTECQEDMRKHFESVMAEGSAMIEAGSKKVEAANKKYQSL